MQRDTASSVKQRRQRILHQIFLREIKTMITKLTVNVTVIVNVTKFRSATRTDKITLTKSGTRKMMGVSM